MCTQCESLTINGFYCHEGGCSDAWEDESRECSQCGAEFNPDFEEQTCCCEDCATTYYN